MSIKQVPNQAEPSAWAEFIAPALTVVFGMQSIRVLLPYLQYILGDRFGWSAVQLGLVGFAIFASGFLIDRLNIWLGLRRLLLVSAGGLGLVRLVTQLWSGDPLGDLILVMIGTILFVLFLPAFLISRQWQSQPVAGSRRFAWAILLGLALDTALHGAFQTYDFIWQPGLIPLILTVGLVVAQWFALRLVLPLAPPHPAPLEGSLLATLPWLAVGPFIFLELLIFQNQARLATLTDWSLPVVFSWVLASHLIGLELAVWWRPGRTGTALTGVILIISLWPIGAVAPPISAIFVALGQIAMALLLAGLLPGLGAEMDRAYGLIGTPAQPKEGLRNTAISHGLGMILLVGLIFAFYVTFSLRVPYQKDWIPPLAGLIITVSSLKAAGQAVPSGKLSMAAAATVPLSLLALPLLSFLTWDLPPPNPNQPEALRVMTYNIHNGFNAKGQLDLEALAQVIEAEAADIVALQEVSRGWVINGSTEMFSWLSHRLEMPYRHFTPSSDTLWGQAVLSRYPILLAEDQPLPPRNLPLNRSFTYLQLDIDQAEPWQMVNTHLHNPPEDSAIRVLQIETILQFLADNRSNQLLLTGDLNAEPTTPEIQLLYEWGFRDVIIDAGLSPGYTFPSPRPQVRFDYILTSPDLSATQVKIPATTASDHLGIAATLDED